MNEKQTNPLLKSHHKQIQNTPELTQRDRVGSLERQGQPYFTEQRTK